MKLLLIEDDENFSAEMKRYFQTDHTIYCAGTLKAAREVLQTFAPDAAVLDLMLPDGNGISLLKEGVLVCPTIILTTVARDDCVIEGLDAGAEDYVVKPCSLPVLAKRLERRLPKENGERRFGNLRIDPCKRTVTHRGVPVRLTSSEFNILYFLAAHENQSYSVSQIYEAVWEMPALGTKTCKVHLYYLRRKLEEVTNEQYILTDFGKGYYFSGSGKS